MTTPLSVKVVTPADGPCLGTIFLLSGFPDLHNTFMDTIVPHLQEDYRCVVACLPDYDKGSLGNWWGYNAAALDARIQATMEQYCHDHSPVTMVLHDWGAVYGLRWLQLHGHGFPVAGVVALDVLLVDGYLRALREAPKQLFWFCLYQWAMAIAFLLGRAVPPLGNLAMLLFYLTGLGPDLAPPSPRVIAPPKGPRWFMCYPYIHFWLDLIRDRTYGRLPGLPSVPLLYFYGTRKRLQFHHDAALQQVEQSSTNKVLALDCGHWVQHAFPTKLAQSIKEFVKRSYQNK